MHIDRKDIFEEIAALTLHFFLSTGNCSKLSIQFSRLESLKCELCKAGQFIALAAALRHNYYCGHIRYPVSHGNAHIRH